MRTVSIKLSPALDARLSILARRRGMTRSALIREAIELLAKAHRTGLAEGSFLELAGPLCGVVEGPRDLSTNPRHLRGYGW